MGLKAMFFFAVLIKGAQKLFTKYMVLGLMT